LKFDVNCFTNVLTKELTRQKVSDSGKEKKDGGEILMAAKKAPKKKAAKKKKK
jgi:hypothetical protein